MSRTYQKRTAGDYGDVLTYNLQESDGTKSDLAGYTEARFQVRLERDVPGEDALRVDKVMTVESPEENGVVSYTVQSTDFPFAGLFFAQVEVAFAAPAKEITWDIAVITVEEQHG